MQDADAKLMRRAIELARGGDPSPNPHVGCLVSRGDQVIAEAFHEAAGQDHAEIAALKLAGERARGATLTVTLEPCNHDGRTPPCVDAILAAGIGRVVLGAPDPNPRVRGGGAQRLREAGVEVVEGVLEAEAKELIRPWARFIVEEISYLSLKLAVSLDGRIATRSGASRWITCEDSRLRVQGLRARNDAVMVGINTVLTDNPRLTVRDVSGRNPVRIVVDSRLRLPLTSEIVKGAGEVSTCVMTTPAAPRAAEEALTEAGLRVIRVPATAEGRCDPVSILKELAARDIVNVLCEGGAEMAGSLIANQLVDELHVFIGPSLLGPRGRPGAVDWAGPESPGDAPRIDPPRWELCGSDAYVWGPVTYSRRAAHPS